MTFLGVAPCGARLRVSIFRGRLAVALLASVLTPILLLAQPVLPRSVIPYVRTADQAIGISHSTSAHEVSQPERAPDPYPRTRRADDIHRGPELSADIIGWVALGRVLWSSGYDQVAASPKPWPRTTESYGRRFATRSAQLVTIEVVRHGFAEVLNRDPAYVRCACTGFGARLGHVAHGVVTDFDEDGTRRVGWPRFAGALAGSVMLGQLQPGQGAAGTVAFRALTTVAGSFLGNAVKEIGLFGTH